MSDSTVGRILAVVGMLMLSGCAQDSGPHPSYLGLSSLVDSSSAEAAPADQSDESEALRHIQSNKVLSAMAFQKVTGQAVDPDRLLGHDNNN